MNEFKEKLKTMTAKDVVLAMVKGLKKQWVKVDMSSFGYRSIDICYGCAATNTICEINNKSFDDIVCIGETWDRARFVKATLFTINMFERAIDLLRMGNIEGYNEAIRRLRIKQLEIPKELEGYYLPVLRTDSYKENLSYYVCLANLL